MKFINHFIHTLVLAVTFSAASFAMDNEKPRPPKTTHHDFLNKPETSKREL